MTPTASDLAEIWDLQLPPLPPRSRFYRLEPVGIGSAWVESLTSYFTRLAQAHSVQLSTLTFYEMLPLLGLQHVNSLDAHVWRSSASINTVGEVARNWAAVLNTLTGRADLQLLTLRPWAAALHARGLSRGEKAWCPRCYEEWRTTDQPVYDPLAWSIASVQHCLKHGVALVKTCPACSRRVSPLTTHSRPGMCPYCGQWLGRPARDAQTGQTPLTERPTCWQQWGQAAVGELLAAMPNLPAALPPVGESISRAVRAYLQGPPRRPLDHLARKVQVSIPTISNLRDGFHIPGLPILLRLCATPGIMPLQLLLGPDPGTPDPELMSLPIDQVETRAALRKHRPFDRETIRHELESALTGEVSEESPPPSMQSVADRLDYHPAFLARHFPELCRAIAARRKSWVAEGAVRRRLAVAATIRTTVLELHARGVYPSIWKVKTFLAKHSVLRTKPAMEAYWQALQEVGLR